MFQLFADIRWNGYILSSNQFIPLDQPEFSKPNALKTYSLSTICPGVPPEVDAAEYVSFLKKLYFFRGIFSLY